MAKITPEQFEGVWSATPTPFTEKWAIDRPSVKRLINHHLRLGVKGLFLGGTCGEGAWMPERDLRTLVETAVEAADGRLAIAVQVSDNSSARILDNVAKAKADGADLAIIAPPQFLMNATPANIKSLYVDAIQGSSLPVAVYDLGKIRGTFVPPEVLKSLYAESNVVAIKDSSGDPERMKIALAARRKRPEMRLLTGGEFNTVEYLKAGYDGVMLGGAAFNGYLAGLIRDAVIAGDIAVADELQAHMNEIMYTVYGGRDIKCWLAGEKRLLMELGVFKTYNNYLKFPLTASCAKAIEKLVKTEAELLLPEAPKVAKASKAKAVAKPRAKKAAVAQA